MSCQATGGCAKRKSSEEQSGQRAGQDRCHGLNGTEKGRESYSQERRRRISRGRKRGTREEEKDCRAEKARTTQKSLSVKGEEGNAHVAKWTVRQRDGA